MFLKNNFKKKIIINLIISFQFLITNYIRNSTITWTNVLIWWQRHLSQRKRLWLTNIAHWSTISVLFGNGKYLACVCYIHCFFIIVRLRNFFPLSLLFYAIPVSFGDFPLSIVVLWGTIVDKWLPIKIVFCCPHLLPVIYENEAIYCIEANTKNQLSTVHGDWKSQKKSHSTCERRELRLHFESKMVHFGEFLKI